MNSTTTSTPRLTDADLREVRPFFILVMLVLAGIYAFAVYSTPDLRAPIRLIPFTAIMLIHAALHWISPRFTTGQLRPAIVYLTIQGVLAFALNLLAHNLSIAFGLYAALIGEAVGALRDRRLAAGAIATYLALGSINFVLGAGWGSLSSWFFAALPMTLFVVIYVVLYQRQAEARERAQALLAELETAHRQLVEYAAQVEDLTLANERQRMARELHDTLAQGLAGLILQLEAANSHLTSNRFDRAQMILQQAMARARATLADSRRAIDDLRTGAGRDAAEAIRVEVSRFTEATGIPCSLDLTLLPALPDSIREHALRAISEGLNNVARHAKAKEASVRVGSSNGWLEIEVRDDGVGFDPVAAKQQSGHYGLLGMRERARLAGGALEIDSARGSGTTLKLRLPVKVEAE
ncbi:MAG TPA: sensor histidine kinase [Anaerolineales bacterium]|nr:sensor histidine kinase [Anaerolineales bacterium]